MVRRILPDSDFESDSEPSVSPQVLTAQSHLTPGVAQTDDAHNENIPPSTECPRVARRLVRPQSPLVPGTYEYDSDVYTEESSIGSFIVYTDEEIEDRCVSDRFGTSSTRLI